MTARVKDRRKLRSDTSCQDAIADKLAEETVLSIFCGDSSLSNDNFGLPNGDGGGSVPIAILITQTDEGA
mgnify:CR=1 FL=1